MTDKPKIDPRLKFALDMGPLLLFFIGNVRYGLFGATAVLMVAVLAALVISFALTRHLAVMPVVSAIVVLVFGGLTLWLQDETFVKLKPTIIYMLFGATLLSGYLLDKPLLEIVFDSVLHLTEKGWRKLTLRWTVFFFVLAGLNEAIWRTQSTDFWVNAKVFGFTTLTVLFGVLQVPLFMKYGVEPEPAKE
jgi:intracellular septation protein